MFTCPKFDLEKITSIPKNSCGATLKGQSHHDFVLLENPMEVLQLIVKPTNSCLALLKRTVLVTKVV